MIWSLIGSGLRTEEFSFGSQGCIKAKKIKFALILVAYASAKKKKGSKFTYASLSCEVLETHFPLVPCLVCLNWKTKTRIFASFDRY